MIRPTLVSLLAGVAALAAVANGVAVSAGPPPAQPDTRLGVSIKQSLGERDRAAVQRQRALDLREQATLATEQRLKAQMAERPARAGAMAPRDGSASEPDQYESLARIYQAMKPAKAARVFEQLDIAVQTRVALKMRDRATGAILAAMDPKAAARLSMALARQHVITAPVAAAAPRR